MKKRSRKEKKTDEIVTKDQQHLARSKSSFRTDLASFLHRGSAVLIVAARESFVEKVSLLNDDADGDLSIGSSHAKVFTSSSLASFSPSDRFTSSYNFV